MKFSLIVPIAGDKQEYDNIMPYIFNLDKDGVMLCIKSILGLNLSTFDNIYFTILNKHNIKYYIDELLISQFKRFKLFDKAKIVVLNKPTRNQAETIYETIKIENITGAFMVKDPDSYFESVITPGNAICIYPLDALNRVNPQDKSYVDVDDMYYITNIIEKKIINRNFCCGGYVFENTNLFIEKYNELSSYKILYLSHIILALLLDKISFRPILVRQYTDWGTKQDWLETIVNY